MHRHANQAKSVRKGLAPRTLYGRYCEYAYSSLENASVEERNLGSLKEHMKCPYEQIYIDDESVCEEKDDDDIGEYFYINAYDDDSEGDEDYIQESDEILFFLTIL